MIAFVRSHWPWAGPSKRNRKLTTDAGRSDAKLFDSDPQFREKETLRRYFSALPLWGGMAEGRLFQWFAVNIPMSLAGDPAFTSDMDVITCLRDVPSHPDRLIYRAWEVKVSLLGRDGRARSSKAGKIRKLLNQLGAYRRFGAPEVSLLDIFLCADGALEQWPGSAEEDIVVKGEACKSGGFGYCLSAFEDFDLAALRESSILDPKTLLRVRRWSPNPMHTTATLVRPVVTPIGEPFSTLVALIEDFRQEQEKRSPVGRQIYYCRNCQQLQIVHSRSRGACPTCGSELAWQT